MPRHSKVEMKHLVSASQKLQVQAAATQATAPDFEWDVWAIRVWVQQALSWTRGLQLASKSASSAELCESPATPAKLFEDQVTRWPAREPAGNLLFSPKFGQESLVKCDGSGLNFEFEMLKVQCGPLNTS